jgi:two-component system, chemotaxis family, chemotaxis protein CheY
VTRRVLSVGQCGVDHAALRRMIEGRFDAAVVAADHIADALAVLAATPFDLVLVNRILDADGDEGLDLVRQMQADPALCHVPVMLVTNYAEHQQRAIAAGARPGFGKSQLGRPETIELLASALGPASGSA